MYSWQFSDWPNFTYDSNAFRTGVDSYTNRVTQLLERIGQLSNEDIYQYLVDRLVEEAITTSSIEGEKIGREDLVSSVMNNLNIGGRLLSEHQTVSDLRARAIGRQIVLNRETFADPLTETALKYWHELLLGYDDRLKVVGEYRRGKSPMRIVSGPAYRQKIHYEAPPADRVPREMTRLVSYCNASVTEDDCPVLRAGVAHFWFESIHPFEDGNGRIGRALLEKLLSQHLGAFIPFSLSHAIEQRRKEYYAALRDSQTSLDITPWMTYFCNVLSEAVTYAEELVEFTVRKHAYFQRYGDLLNEHESKAIKKMFAAGPSGFTGGMTNRKYVSINRVSPSTAARALHRLAKIGALQMQGAGRSVHYVLPT
ncbi:Fic family protein [Lewinella aquimaris]|uniref:Fic family protein n=1 Tax=Neolewinella aquimaris TaxID=1835722 RepID=A0A840E7F2_9BACT|nr:DUF4172 domain-containing protein [Neolewinella aquimaris]MBB4079555.1 Fic family protein [Neolewinella aquimaris]